MNSEIQLAKGENHLMFEKQIKKIIIFYQHGDELSRKKNQQETEEEV